MRAKSIFEIGAISALAFVVAACFAPRAAARPQKRASPHARQMPNASHSLKSETRLIAVDVSVRDKHGNPVRGLKPSDFKIYDDGHGPQQIAQFEFLEPPAKAPVERAATSQPTKEAKRPPVYSNQKLAHLSVPPTAILLDPGTIAFADQVTARLQTLKLLDKLPADTPVAVFLLAGNLTVVQNFTTDRTLLRAAVIRSMIPLFNVKNPQDDESERSPSFSQTGASGGTQDATAVHDFEKLEYEEQTTVIADQTSDAMRAIAKDLSGYPGRKNLIWISEAFPQWILPGSGFGAHSVEAGDSSSLKNPFRQTFEASANYGDKLRSDAQALVDARVTVYPVDARGLVPPGLYDASGNPLATDPAYSENPAIAGPGLGAELAREATDLTFSQATIEQIARDTGGTACVNTNDLSGCATTAVEDGSPDYEISYYPAGVKWDGSFHRITLKTDLHEVRIQYRRGYSAVDTLDMAAKHPMQLFRQACASLLPVTSIGLRAEALQPTEAGASRYLLSISPNTLSVTPDGHTLELHLRLGVCEFAPSGGRFRIRTRNFSKKFPELDAGKWQKQDIQSAIDYKSKSQTRRLRLAILDPLTGMTGTVDVPAHPRVVFSIAELNGAGGTRALLYSHLAFHSTTGAFGALDPSGSELKYRGKLGIELAAPAFFHSIYGKEFQCEAGKLVPNDGNSGRQPDFRFAFKNPAGLFALIDLAGSKPEYTGALPVDASARTFFDRLWKLCHCEQP